jgi:sugar-specific transcriptional regulator TrmB
MQKQQLYPCLKNLQSKGIVTATSKCPALFSALPLEKVLDLLIKADIEEVQRMIQNKEELLSSWQSMTLSDSRT